jgi:hypothetical protein
MAEAKIGMRVKATVQVSCTKTTGGSGVYINGGTTGTVQSIGARPTVYWDSGYTTFLDGSPSIVFVAH